MLPVPPPVLPMLAKRVEALPDGDGWIFEPKWDGFRALVFRDGDESDDPEPRREAAESILPRARGDAERDSSPSAACSTARSSSPRGGARLRGAAAPHPPGGVAREAPGPGDPGVGRLLGSALPRRPRSARRALPRAARRARGAPREREGPRAPHARDARPGRRRGLVRALRGRGARRRDGEARERRLRAEQARDVQGEARARVRLRRRGLPLAQAGRGHRRRLALARALRRRGRAPARRRVRELHRRTSAASSSRILAPYRENALATHPWKHWAGETDGEGEGAQRVPGAKSRWSQGKDLSWEPLRPELVVRGGVRSHAGDALSTYGAVSPLAHRQGAAGLHATRSSRSSRPRSWGRSSRGGEGARLVRVLIALDPERRSVR